MADELIYLDREFNREGLKQIAIGQKVILFCILGILGCVAAYLLVPPELKIIFLLVQLVFNVVAAVFIFRISIKAFGPANGIFAGICTLLPCISLIVILIINQKVTTLLNYFGYKVGFMGASLSQFEGPVPRLHDREPRRRRRDDDDDREER